MIGGGGFDNYVVDNAADVVTEGIDEGFDQVQAGIDYRLAAGTEIEVLYATTDGTDPVSLTGNEFDNVVVGNDGDNVIAGGGGQDTLYGHAGSDRFVWTSTDETVLAGQDADVIMDFSRADGDVIDVSQIDADAGGGTANDAFTFVGVVDVSAGASFTAPGQIGYFTADTDGDGAADQTYILLNTETDAGIDYQDATIRIAGAHTVDASWFAL
jgi:Ca2+-binding RTX toxin-like protein